MLSLSGFNAFNQLCSIRKVLYECSPSYIRYNCETVKSDTKNYCNNLSSFHNLVNFFPLTKSQFSLSWSYSFACQGDTLWLCGLIDKKDNYIQRVKSVNHLKILQASCNRRQVVCVTEDGGCWQYNLETESWKNLTSILYAELPNENITQEAAIKVSCGETVTAVLTARGDVYNVPNKMTLPGIKIVDVMCGRSHILMLSDKGEIFSAGEGSRGQLGHGELECEEEPRLVEGLAGLTVLQIACGGWHSCAITADGDLYSWGWNMSGQLGSCIKEPTKKVSVQAVPKVVDWPDDSEVHVIKVACGSRHTVALLDDGSVWGCGWNAYGQLALPDVENVALITKLPTPSSIQDLLCGPWNTCLLT